MTEDFYTLETGDLSENRSANAENEAYSDLVKQIYNCLNMELIELISQMMKDSTSTLQMLSDAEKKPDNKKSYQEVISLMGGRLSNVDKAFFMDINEKLKPASQTIKNTDVDKEDDSDLALIDQDEMEEMVAITTIHANALNTFGTQISHLETRLEYLEISSAEIFDKNALEPKNICEAFHQTLNKLNVAVSHQMILFRLFDRSVIQKLGHMYKTLNKLFIDADILPNIFTATGPQEADSGMNVSAARYYNPQDNKATDFIPRTEEEVNSYAADFMSGAISSTSTNLPASFTADPSTDDKDGKKFYDRKDVMDALSKLQNRLTNKNTSTDSKEQEERIDAEQIKRNLVADMGKKNGGAVTKEVNLLDQRTIDFIGMMFDNFAEDEDISQVITSLLMRLQIPVIKVAMLDQDLFAQKEHPARCTLNLVSEAGKGVTEEEDEVYVELEHIVDDVLERYDVDIASFEKAAESLQKLIANDQNLSDENEKEGQRNTLLQHGREIIVNEIKRLSTHKKLPGPVKPLVLKHWSSMMLNHYVNYGKDSDQWIQSVLILKMLLKCLQPIKNAAQFEMIKDNHETVTEAVNDELYETNQDKDEINDQVEKLKRTFKKMIDQYGFKLILEADEEGNTSPSDLEGDSISNLDDYKNEMEDDSEEKARIKEEEEIARAKIIQLPSTVKPGVWFEVFNGAGKPVRRVKMSVLMTELAKIIFVDSHGIKVIEKDADEFARELEDSKSRFIADHSSFDHALGNVIRALAS